MSNKQSEGSNWSIKDSAVQQLAQAFQKYENTNGRAGIKPTYERPSDEQIQHILTIIPGLRQYKQHLLKKNIGNLARKVQFETSAKRGRNEKGK